MTSHHFNLEHHLSRGDYRRVDHRDYRAGAGDPSAEPAATARRIRRRMHVRAS
jgi:hypothetical protein